MGLYQKFFAHSLALGDDAQHRVYGDRKQALFADLTGTVVEVGPGTGVNVPYLPDGLRWIGLEPNPHMHDYIASAFDGRDVDWEVRAASAQDTGLPDASVDAVISTLVLCSVPDLDATLAELHRILKPDGSLSFIEHVVADDRTWLRWVQTGIRPFWGLVADGCRPDRDTGAALERAGFSDVKYTRFDAPLPIVTPHIIGTARK